MALGGKSNTRIRSVFAAILLLMPLFALAENNAGSNGSPVPPPRVPRTGQQAVLLVEGHGRAWYEAQKEQLFKNWLLNDRSDPNSFSGAIYAAESGGRPPSADGKDPGEPNYQFHWTRDSALVASAAASLYFAPEASVAERERYALAVGAYIRFSRQIQQLPTRHDWLVYRDNQIQFTTWRDGREVPVDEHTPGAFAIRYGEPKFRVVQRDGKWVPEAYNDSWGRPQNDGPALRASAIMDATKVLEQEIARKKAANLDTKQEEATLREAAVAIREDMRYIRAMWQHPSFDIWEEVLGNHFFHRVAQSEALERGVEALKRLGLPLDPLEEQGMKDTQVAIEKSLNDFVNAEGRIDAFNDMRNSRPPLNSKLDMAVILAALRRRNKSFSASDPRVMATAMALLDHFRNDPRFKDEPGQEKPGIPIGRYPGDAWNGQRRVTDVHGNAIEGANPWVLTTLAMEEYFLRVGVELQEKGEVVINARNRAFFEYVYGGADKLPSSWRDALNAGQEVHERLESGERATALFDNLKSRAAEFTARLIASGIDPSKDTSEQYAVVPRAGSDGQLGARRLSWNSSKLIDVFDVRTCFLKLTKIAPHNTPALAH